MKYLIEPINTRFRPKSKNRLRTVQASLASEPCLRTQHICFFTIDLFVTALTITPALTIYTRRNQKLIKVNLICVIRLLNFGLELLPSTIK